MTATSFHHEAALYAGEEEFAERSRAFVEEGLDQGEAVLVLAGPRKLELLRSALGGRAADVRYDDMEVVGRNPGRIIPAWRRFLSDHANRGGAARARGIGEPIWAGRSAAELAECQLHEALINLAFADADSFRLMCPYDTRSLPDEVIEEARRSHPVVSEGGLAGEPSSRYPGMVDVASAFAGPLPEPPARADEMRVSVGGLHDARELVRRHALAAGLGARSDDFVLAVNEVLSNSLNHARDDGLLRVWQDPRALVCEVRDTGHIMHPLIGREEPAPGQVGGHGMWLVNLVCDLVQIRSSPRGSAVRMYMGRPLT